MYVAYMNVLRSTYQFVRLCSVLLQIPDTVFCERQENGNKRIGSPREPWAALSSLFLPLPLPPSPSS
jgi:hypothetical protein